MVIFFNTHSKRTSWVGATLSFSLLILLLLNFAQSDFVLKISPYVVTETITNRHSDNIVFDQNKLLMFGVSDDNNIIIIDDSIFSFAVNYYHYETDEDGKYALLLNKTFDFHICNETDIDQSKLTELGLKNAHCLDEKSFFFEGHWDEKTVTFMEISLFICQNSSDFKCKSKEEIEYFFQSKYFQVSSYEVSVKFQDYKNPLKPEYRITYELVDIEMHKEMSVYFKNVELTTDDGFLFSNKNVQQDFTFDKSSVAYQLIPQGSNLIFDIDLYASHDKVQHTRRYQTISEVLASLSGTANFFMFFCFFITNLKNYLNTMIVILNALYTYPDVNQDEKNNNKENRKESKIFFKKSFQNEADELFNENKGSRIIEKSLDENELVINGSFEELPEKKNVLRKKDPPNVSPFKLKNSPSNIIFQPKEINHCIPAKNLDNDPFILIHYSQEKIKKHHNPIFELSKYMLPREFSSRFTSINQSKTIEVGANRTSSLKILEAKNKKFSVGFFEYIKYWLKKFCFLKKTRKESWIEKSEKIFKKELDIISILEKLKEFEKLKLILLNEDQLTLFDSLSKPMLNLKENKIFQKYENQPSIKMLKLIRTSHSARRNKELWLKSFNNLQKAKFNKNYEDEINKRLINLLE